jgi:hypothetical protein
MKVQVTTILTLILILTLAIVPASASVTFASSSPDTIAKGDSFTITGTGAGNGSVSLWVIGRNYFGTTTAEPDKNGSYQFTMQPEMTRQFSSGQYAFIIQDPGKDGKRQIESHISGKNISVTAGRIEILDLGPAQNLRANVEPEVSLITSLAGRQGSDDTLTPYYFFVEEPFVHFDQVPAASTDSRLPNQTAGDPIVINGTTNIGVDNKLLVVIHKLDTNAIISSDTISITPGSRINHWSFSPGNAALPAGEYYITVGWQKSATTGTGSAQFTVVQQSTGGIYPPAIAAGGIVLVLGIVGLGLRKK